MSKFIAEMYTIFAYCTRGPYEQEAEKLRRSIQQFPYLHYQIDYTDDRGSWEKNTNLKPRMIRSAIIGNKRPVLYIDVDAQVKKDPSPLVGELITTADVAAHYRAGKELLSGTLFWNNTPATMAVLDEWIAEVTKHPQRWDQKNLQDVIDRNVEKIRFVMLPAEYCLIDDKRLMTTDKEPVILQHQASRRLKT